MRTGKIKTGFTLVELLTVVSIILVLAVVGLPAARKVLDSFESSGSIRYLVSAALANARAIAAREQAYAGLRFQQNLDGNQYMIFIVNDPASAPSVGNLADDPTLTGTGLANGFRAVTGYKPMRLPVNVGVMDLRIKLDYEIEYPKDSEVDIEVEGDDAASNVSIELPEQLTDTTTFSILFSPAGKLVIHEVRTRNRHGRRATDSSTDDVFNTENNVDNHLALFYQDDYADRGLGQELSRNNFVIYDKRQLDAVNADSRWTDYLQHLEVIYISPYTGQIINR